MMAINNTTVVLAHGAWADGSSWAKVIAPLAASGVKVVAAPLPLTSFHDDLAALDRSLERVEGPVVLAGHAYAGGVIGAIRNDKVKALVYVAALAPDEGETVADVFSRGKPHPQAPKLRPDEHGLIYLPKKAFAGLCAKCFKGGACGAGSGAAADLARLHNRQGGPAAMEGSAGLVPGRRTGSHDHRRQSPLHGRADEGPDSVVSC
jgi:pimeloyl-ACP methyl ester carboxylesterase